MFIFAALSCAIVFTVVFYFQIFKNFFSRSNNSIFVSESNFFSNSVLYVFSTFILMGPVAGSSVVLYSLLGSVDSLTC